MKVLNTFEEALDYVNRLGFAGAKGPGWIPVAQGRMCDVIEALECSALCTTVEARKKRHNEIFKQGGILSEEERVYPYPFSVRFNRPTGYMAGILRYGTFTVKKDGKTSLVVLTGIKSL
jgi:hypothetical protein